MTILVASAETSQVFVSEIIQTLQQFTVFHDVLSVAGETVFSRIVFKGKWVPPSGVPATANENAIIVRGPSGNVNTSDADAHAAMQSEAGAAD